MKRWIGLISLLAAMQSQGVDAQPSPAPDRRLGAEVEVQASERAASGLSLYGHAADVLGLAGFYGAGHLRARGSQAVVSLDAGSFVSASLDADGATALVVAFGGVMPIVDEATNLDAQMLWVTRPNQAVLAAQVPAARLKAAVDHIGSLFDVRLDLGWDALVGHDAMGVATLQSSLRWMAFGASIEVGSSQAVFTGGLKGAIHAVHVELRWHRSIVVHPFIGFRRGWGASAVSAITVGIEHGL